MSKRINLPEEILKTVWSVQSAHGGLNAERPIKSITSTPDDKLGTDLLGHDLTPLTPRDHFDALLVPSTNVTKRKKALADLRRLNRYLVKRYPSKPMLCSDVIRTIASAIYPTKQQMKALGLVHGGGGA